MEAVLMFDDKDFEEEHKGEEEIGLDDTNATGQSQSNEIESGSLPGSSIKGDLEI